MHFSGEPIGDRIEITLVQPEPTFAEWITVLGILFTLLIGVVNIIIAVNRNRTDGVTNNRVIWIQDVRNLVSKIAAIDWMIDESVFNEAAYQLSTYLNPAGQFDRVITELLVDLAAAKTEAKNPLKTHEFTESKRVFILACQVYLKAEWDRVKWENRVIKCGKYNEAKRIKRLLKNFDSNNPYVKQIKARYEFLCSANKVNPSFFKVSCKYAPNGSESI